MGCVIMDQKKSTENVLVSEKLQGFEDTLHGEDSSCSSSLGTSVSEVEDLFLGAEAHSFEKKKKLSKIETMRNAVGHMRKLKSASSKILILKHCESLGGTQMCQLQVSALKSVRDVIAAREFDACTVLVNLGFGYCNSNVERNEILRRFKGSDNLVKKHDGPASSAPKKSASEDNITIEKQKVEVIRAMNTPATPSPSFENDAKGIYKTAEWLNSRHNQLPSSPDALAPTEGKSARKLTCETATVLSSVLPLRKVLTTTAITGNLHRLAKKRNRFSKSRQSSFDIMPGLEEEDDIVSSTAHPSHETHGDSSIPSTFHSAPQLSRADERITPAQEQDKGKTARKTSNLVNQKESFELEEINSNEDVPDSRHLSPSRRLQENLQTAIQQEEEGQQQQSLVDSPLQLTQKEDDLIIHEEEDVDEENESSSGFDEDEISHHLKMCEEDDDKANVILRSVVETIETACCPHMTHHSQHVEYVVDEDAENNTVCQQQDETPCANTNNNNNNNSSSGKPTFAANYVLLHGKKPSQLNRNKPALVRLKSGGRRLLVNKQQVDRDRCLGEAVALRQTSETLKSAKHDDKEDNLDEQTPMRGTSPHT